MGLFDFFKKKKKIIEDGLLPEIDDIRTIVQTDEEILKLTKDLGLVKNINFKDDEEFHTKFLKYSNNQIKEIFCVINDIRIGKWIKYYENGRIKFISNRNKEGSSDGVTIEYDENGGKINEKLFENGEFLSNKSYYENGQLKQERTFKNEYFISQKCWDEDGNEIDCE